MVLRDFLSPCATLRSGHDRDAGTSGGVGNRGVARDQRRHDGAIDDETKRVGNFAGGRKLA
jgi:hypothetical protein